MCLRMWRRRSSVRWRGRARTVLRALQRSWARCGATRARRSCLCRHHRGSCLHFGKSACQERSEPRRPRLSRRFRGRRLRYGQLPATRHALEVTRHRRWPIFGLGAMAVAGLALFLLVRPSHIAAPPAATDTPSVASKASAITGAPLRQEPMGNPAPVAPAPPSGVDGGAAPPAVAGAAVPAKPSAGEVPHAVAGVPPHPKRTRAAEPRHPPASNSSNSGNQWLFLH